MKTVAIIAFWVLLMMPCIAEPDNVTTGPYNISFDLGLPHDAYSIKIDDPIKTESLAGDEETRYFVSVETKSIKTQTAVIDITEYAEAQPGTVLSSGFQINLLQKMFPSVPVKARTIDGKDGAVAQYTSQGVTMFFAMYYLDEYTWVQPMSSLPWDEGTLSLLKTLHIEKTRSPHNRVS